MGSIPQLSVVRGPSHHLPRVSRLSHIFEENTLKTPHSIAIIYKGVDGTVHKLTYSELDRAANRLAHSILSRTRTHRGTDCVVAVSQPPSDALLLTLLAVWKAGAAYLPLDQQAAHRVQHIVSEAKPALIITDQAPEEWDAVLRAQNTVSFHTLDSEATDKPDTKPTLSSDRSSSLAIVLYTSGSTGVPKGVRLSQPCVLNRLRWQWRELPYSATERVCVFKTTLTLVDAVSEIWGPLLHPSPLALLVVPKDITKDPQICVRLSHPCVLNRLRWQWREFPYSATERVCVFKTTLTFVDAVSEIWGPLLHPSPLALLVVPKHITKDPQRLIPLLDEYKIERLLVVPSLLRAILMFLSLDKAYQLNKLKTWVCSGEPLVTSLAQQFLDHFHNQDVELCNFYGSTEVMGDVTFHVIRSHEDLNYDKVPIGRPVDNTNIYLLNRQLQVVPVGEVGELYVSGLNVCAGYINDRDPHKFVTNPHTVDPEHARLYHTGDYGRLVKGVVLYEGRTDSQVKVRGHRVDLAEIDAALNKLQHVDKTAVLCYKPGEVDQAVIAYVTLRQGVKCLAEDIESALQTHLAVYAVPQVLVIDAIPLLNNGKVDRQTLLKKYEELATSSRETYQVSEAVLAGVSERERPKAESVLRTVAAVLGGSARGQVTLDANFYHLGGNSLNSVLTVTRLRDQGYLIGITEFISAKTLRDVVNRMELEDSETEHKTIVSGSKQKPYVCEIMQNKHKADVYRIINDSFYEKGDLEGCLEPRIPREDYVELLDKIWEPLVQQQLSFVLRSPATDQVVSVALSFDLHDEPPVTLGGRLNIVFEFLEFVEAPVREKELPQGKGKVVHAFMMGTDKSLSAAENVVAIQTMEEEVLDIAKRRGFIGIFTTNSSPLTKQLGTDVFNYQVMSEVQANKYTATDGSKPFISAPDSLRVSCSWKLI